MDRTQLFIQEQTQGITCASFFEHNSLYYSVEKILSPTKLKVKPLGWLHKREGFPDLWHPMEKNDIKNKSRIISWKQPYPGHIAPGLWKSQRDVFYRSLDFEQDIHLITNN